MVEGKGGAYVCIERRGLRGNEGAYCLEKEYGYVFVYVYVYVHGNK